MKLIEKLAEEYYDAIPEAEWCAASSCELILWAYIAGFKKAREMAFKLWKNNSDDELYDNNLFLSLGESEAPESKP